MKRNNYVIKSLIVLILLGSFAIADEGSSFNKQSQVKLSSSSMKNYNVTIFSKKSINSNFNKLKLKISNKTTSLSGLDVTISIYDPSRNLKKYKHIKNYMFDYYIDYNLYKKGEYTYIVKFTKHIGGVVHSIRGSFNIK